MLSFLACAPAYITFEADTGDAVERTVTAGPDTGDTGAPLPCLVLDDDDVTLDASTAVAVVPFPACAQGAAVACTAPFTGAMGVDVAYSVVVGVSWQPSEAVDGACILTDGAGETATITVHWLP